MKTTKVKALEYNIDDNNIVEAANMNSSEENVNVSLAEILKKAIGNRTIRKFAKEAGIDPSIIARIISGSYKPGVKMIYRLGGPKVKLENGVTLRDLLYAANYGEYYEQDKNSLMFGMASMSLGAISPIMVAAGKKYLKEKSIHDDNQNKNLQEGNVSNIESKQIESMFTGVIYNHLISQGIKFQPESVDRSLEETRPNISITILDDKELKWWFEFCDSELNVYDNCIENYDNMAKAYLAKIFFQRYDDDRKISFVTDNVYLHAAFKKFADGLSYRGNISVILIDLQELVVVEEKTLC